MNPRKAKALALKSVQRPIHLGRKERLAELNPEMMFLGDSIEDTTYDKALIGSVQKPCQGFVACYDYNKCVECLMKNGMDREDALEWMETNVVSAYVGENGPVFFMAHQDEES